MEKRSIRSVWMIGEKRENEANLFKLIKFELSPQGFQVIQCIDVVERISMIGLS